MIESESVWGHGKLVKRSSEEADAISDVKEHVKHFTTEWEQMVDANQNYEDIVKKYTDDAIFIQRENGKIVAKHLGREGE